MNDMLKNIKDKLKKIIARSKDKYSGVCMIAAPIFNEKNISDGYIQRVKAIDDELLNKTLNIYVDFETKKELPAIEQVDERHIYLTLLPKDRENLKLAIWLAKKCGLVYTHSVMRAMPDVLGDDILKLYRQKNVFYIWDVHGSVPEEFALDDNYYEAQNAGEAEEWFVNSANIIIVVNSAMKKHLEDKYSVQLNNVVVLPIFTVAATDIDEMWSEKSKNQFPQVIYAGGLQKWQNIRLMQEILSENKKKIVYKMYVSRPNDFIGGLTNIEDFDSLEIDRKSPEEVVKQYYSSHYGFVLRDDITVNNVACPTKLIEYIQYGVVPILKTEKIGDFVELGMKYISYADYKLSNLNYEEYITYAKENIKIIDKLNEIHNSGILEIKDRLNEKFNI